MTYVSIRGEIKGAIRADTKWLLRAVESVSVMRSDSKPVYPVLGTADPIAVKISLRIQKLY